MRLLNARPISGWDEYDIPQRESLRQSRRYRTCRNYQFAWWLRSQRDAPDAPPEYVPPRRAGEGEQMSLL